MNGFRNQILLGDCLETMATMPSNFIQCVVTSPPYFALRSYLPAGHPDKPKEIGSEPTPDAFIATMVAVFREVRRVMRDDGVCFINLGDSYASATGKCKNPGGGANSLGKNKKEAGAHPLNRHNKSDLDAMGVEDGEIWNIPHRVAEALRQDGWNWRQTIVWAKKSPMPESVRGWAWRRCRVKAGASNRANGHKADAIPHKPHGGYADDGKSFASSAQWSACPGCPKCIPNDGWILQRGKGRCTTAHEYIFVMTKGERYFWDGEASKEAVANPSRSGSGNKAKRWGNNHTDIRSEGTGEIERQSGIPWESCETRNPRSYWLLSSEPTREKHFAAFPSELVRRCLVAGCSAGGCCATCGSPFAPMVESERVPTRPALNPKAGDMWKHVDGDSQGQRSDASPNLDPQRHVAISRTLGYRQTCSCPPAAPGRQIVFDPFSGTGTTAQTARQLGHDYLGCELNPAYIEISDKRIQEPPRWWVRQQNANKPKRPKPVIVAPGQLSLFGSLEESA